MPRRKSSRLSLPNLAKRLLRSRKGGFWVVLIAAAIWYVSEVAQRDDYVYAGVPRQTDYARVHNWVHVIRNPGFLVGYSELRRNPLWVAYRLRPVEQKRHLPRPQGFSVDWRTLMRVSHEDYSRSGYDRGHLAPNYAISQLYGRSAQYATFRMSNITPQRPHLNQELWQRLEEVEIDRFARRLGELWVVTGPVFDNRMEYLSSGVEVPDAFYKMIIDLDDRQQPRVLAFLVPQNVRGDEPLDRFVVTVDEVERVTGFDFFHRLPDDVEQRLESSRPHPAWRLKDVARIQPRFKVGN